MSTAEHQPLNSSDDAQLVGITFFELKSRIDRAVFVGLCTNQLYEFRDGPITPAIIANGGAARSSLVSGISALTKNTNSVQKMLHAREFASPSPVTVGGGGVVGAQSQRASTAASISHSDSVASGLGNDCNEALSSDDTNKSRPTLAPPGSRTKTITASAE